MTKILIIDGEDSVREQIFHYINENLENVQTILHSSPDDAIQYLRSEKADIIISDIFAPEPKCTDVIQYCEVHLPDTRIILTSNHKVFSYAHMAVRCRNVVDFVTKPADMEYLLSTIKDLAEEINPQSTPQTEMSPLLSKRTELFSDIVHGHITSPEEAEKKLIALGLRIPMDRLPCSLVHFHIADFSAQIRKVRLENAEHFYEELATAIPFETDDAYLSLASYSHGNISWFIVQKNKENIPAVLDNITDSVRQILFKKMSLDMTETSRKIWISLNDMIRIRMSESKENSISANSVISEALIYMRKNYAHDLSLKVIAEHVNVSPIYFSSYFKKHTGVNFVSKLTDIRIEQAAKLLITTDMPIRDIKHAVGYKHTGNFYNHFRERYKKTPNDYKEWYFG